MRSHFDEIWASWGPGEKAIYKCTSVSGFFNLCCIYIRRYEGQFFAAKNAFKGVMGSDHIPLDQSRYDGMRRVQLFKTLRDYAELRDRGFDRDDAVAMLLNDDDEESDYV